MTQKEDTKGTQKEDTKREHKMITEKDDLMYHHTKVNALQRFAVQIEKYPVTKYSELEV